MFSPGDHVDLSASGRRARVVRFIGEGGQGRVYEVQVEGDPMPAAFKWYHPGRADRSQRDAIAALVARGAPNARFLWPAEMVDVPGTGSFGYLMPLRDPGHVGLAPLLKGRLDVPLAVRTTLCRELARCFLDLHSQGLCYRDISFANVFFDPMTGRPMVCDNDNVAVDDGSPSPVLGTRRFMAPEVVRNEAQPSRETDLWSLSVLLYYVLVVAHPLIGRLEHAFACWDEAAELELLGRSPRFVFDPDDASNRPDPDLEPHTERNWALLPTTVRELLVRTFTVGARDPRSGRVVESVWQRAMARLEDSIIVCDACGAEGYHDPRAIGAPCWSCGVAAATPLRLVFPGDRWVALAERTRIWDHHVAPLPTYDFEFPIAEVTRHPERRDLWGLRNIGPTSWVALPPGGDAVEVAPGRAFALVPGTTFTFGATAATLEG